MRDVDTLKRMGFDIWIDQYTPPREAQLNARFFSLSAQGRRGLLVLPDHELSDDLRVMLKKMLQAFKMQCSQAHNVENEQDFCLIFGPELTAAFTPALTVTVANSVPITDPHFGRLYVYPDLAHVARDIACKKQIWHDISAYLRS